MGKQKRPRAVKPSKNGKDGKAKAEKADDQPLLSLVGTDEPPANRDFAANQPTIPGMEDVDERVPALEELCKTVLADIAARSDLADSIAEGKEKIEKELGEHNLDCYIVSGRKFYISPSESRVKIEKVKQG